MTENRQWAAVLVTDFVGYNRLTSADEDCMLARQHSRGGVELGKCDDRLKFVECVMPLGPKEASRGLLDAIKGRLSQFDRSLRKRVGRFETL